MKLKEGTLLHGGNYQIVRHVSSGGFGNTYEGLDVVLNRRVAIKEFFVKDFCLRDADSTQVTVSVPSKKPLIEHLRKKFVDEARAIACMEHDNIVKVLTLFEENGTAYYVMDFIDGESVGDLLKRRGPLPESEALPIVLKVASALIGEQLTDDTLIISTSGRNDFRCKGFDVYLEAMRQLNERLRGSDRKVLSLIEVPCWLYGPRQDLQERLASDEQATTPLHTPMITHDLYNLNEDRILCLIKDLGLDNRAENNVKVVLVPCYLDGNDGIFNLHYYDILTANDLTLYPSYYEPWGYTPLESVAFKTPCITTDLSGFGQWVNEVLGRDGKISDGVEVLHRDDRNYHACAAAICDVVQQYLAASPAEVETMRKNAAKFAQKAQWKHFVKYYYDAYAFAMNK